MKPFNSKIPKKYVWGLLAVLAMNSTWQVSQMVINGSAELASKDECNLSEVSQSLQGRKKGEVGALCRIEVELKDKKGKKSTAKYIVVGEVAEKNAAVGSGPAQTGSLIDQFSDKQQTAAPQAAQTPKLDKDGKPVNPSLEMRLTIIKEENIGDIEAVCTTCGEENSILPMGAKTTIADVANAAKKLGAKIVEANKKDIEKQKEEDKMADKVEACEVKNLDGDEWDSDADRRKCYLKLISSPKAKLENKRLAWDNERARFRELFATDPEKAREELTAFAGKISIDSFIGGTPEEIRFRRGMVKSLQSMELVQRSREQIDLDKAGATRAIQNLMYAETPADKQLAIMDLRLAMNQLKMSGNGINTLFAQMARDPEIGMQHGVREDLQTYQQQIARQLILAQQEVQLAVRDVQSGRGGLNARLGGRVGLDNSLLGRQSLLGGDSLLGDIGGRRRVIEEYAGGLGGNSILGNNLYDPLLGAGNNRAALLNQRRLY